MYADDSSGGAVLNCEWMRHLRAVSFSVIMWSCIKCMKSRCRFYSFFQWRCHYRRRRRLSSLYKDWRYENSAHTSCYKEAHALGLVRHPNANSSYLSMSVSLSVCACLSIHISISLSIYLPTYVSVYLSTYLSIYLSVCLCPSIHLSTYLSVSLSIYVSLSLSICLSIYSPLLDVGRFSVS
jgi:hypothetical protein